VLDYVVLHFSDYTAKAYATKEIQDGADKRVR